MIKSISRLSFSINFSQFLIILQWISCFKDFGWMPRTKLQDNIFFVIIRFNFCVYFILISDWPNWHFCKIASFSLAKKPSYLFKNLNIYHKKNAFQAHIGKHKTIFRFWCYKAIWNHKRLQNVNNFSNKQWRQV